MLGVGSNVMVRDGGVEGVVIRLPVGVSPRSRSSRRRQRHRRRRRRWTRRVARAAARPAIAGLEFFAGVPGTIGGALT